MSSGSNWRALIDAEVSSKLELDDLAVNLGGAGGSSGSSGSSSGVGGYTTSTSATQRANSVSSGSGPPSASRPLTAGASSASKPTSQRVTFNPNIGIRGKNVASSSASSSSNAAPILTTSSSSVSSYYSSSNNNNEKKTSSDLDSIFDAPFLSKLVTKRIIDKIAVDHDDDNTTPKIFRVKVDEDVLSKNVRAKSSLEFPPVHRFPLPVLINRSNHELRLPLNFTGDANYDVTASNTSGSMYGSMRNSSSTSIQHGGRETMLRSVAGGGSFDRGETDVVAQIRFLEASFYDNLKRISNLRTDSITIGKFVYGIKIPCSLLELRYLKVTYFLLHQFNEYATDLVSQLGHVRDHKIQSAFHGHIEDGPQKQVYDDAKFAITSAFSSLLDEATISQSTLYNIYECVEEILALPRGFSRRIEGIHSNFDRAESLLSEKYNELSKKSRNFVIYMEKLSLPVNMKVLSYLQSSKLSMDTLDLTGSRFAAGELKEMLKFVAMSKDEDGDGYPDSSVLPKSSSSSSSFQKSSNNYLGNLRFLVFDNCDLDDQDMHNICQILLRSITTINFLSFRNNKFHVAGITALSLCFFDGHGANLRTLRLDNNNLTDDSIAIFSKSLPRLHRLTILSLNNNPLIGDKGCFLVVKNLLINRYRNNYKLFSKTFKHYCQGVFSGVLQSCIAAAATATDADRASDGSSVASSDYDFSQFQKEDVDQKEQQFDDELVSIFSKSTFVTKRLGKAKEAAAASSKRANGQNANEDSSDDSSDDDANDISNFNFEREKVVCFLPLFNGAKKKSDSSNSAVMRKTFNWHADSTTTTDSAGISFSKINDNSSDFMADDPYSDDDNDEILMTGGSNLVINANIKPYVPPALENRYRLCREKFRKIQYKLFMITTLLQLSRRVRIDRLSMQNCGLSYLTVNILRIAMTDRYFDNNNNLASVDLSSNAAIGSTRMTKEIERNLDIELVKLAGSTEQAINMVAKQISFRFHFDLRTVIAHSQLGSLMLANCSLSDEDCQKILYTLSGNHTSSNTMLVGLHTHEVPHNNSSKVNKLEFIDLSNNNMGGTGVNWIVNNTSKYIIESLEFS